MAPAHCLQLVSIHAGATDLISKGKINELNTLFTGNFPDLSDGDGKYVFIALYAKQSGTSMESHPSPCRNKITNGTVLPPTTTNLFLHVLSAHLQVMLW